MIKRIFKNKGIIGIIFVMSFFTHNYIFNSRIMNVDYLGDAIFPYSQAALGRFMPLFLPRMILPVFGLLASIVLTVSVVLVVEIFEINKKEIIIAVAAVMIAFPAIAYSFPYMMNVERVVLGIFFR